MSFSDYLENKMLDHILNDGAYSAPANIFIGLYTATPNDAGGGTEVSGGAYARQSTGASDWDPAAGGSKANSSVVTFPDATADWGVVTHFGIFDAVSGGNLMGYGSLTSSRDVKDGDIIKFTAGNLTVSLD